MAVGGRVEEEQESSLVQRRGILQEPLLQTERLSYFRSTVCFEEGFVLCGCGGALCCVWRRCGVCCCIVGTVVMVGVVVLISIVREGCWRSLLWKIIVEGCCGVLKWFQNFGMLIAHWDGVFLGTVVVAGVAVVKVFNVRLYCGRMPL